MGGRGGVAATASGGGGCESSGRLNLPLGPFGLAMCPRSASHKHKHAWMALIDVSLSLRWISHPCLASIGSHCLSTCQHWQIYIVTTIIAGYNTIKSTAFYPYFGFYFHLFSCQIYISLGILVLNIRDWRGKLWLLKKQKMAYFLWIQAINPFLPS